MAIDQEVFKQAAGIIHDADALLITAGAGIGVDSGLPDFRGNEGFWKAYPPIANLGISFSEMANPHWFERKPELAWGFYGHRLNLYRRTIPHSGFDMLLKLAQSKSAQYFVFTSNVDGQFQKAGFDPQRIEECHGSIHHFQCTIPCCDDIWDGSEITVNVDESIFEAQEPLPLCPNCGALARPNILMFGDWSWIPGRTEAQGYRLQQWLSGIRDDGLKLAVIELGAGTAVPTVRYTSEQVAAVCSGTLIRVNPREAQIPGAGISIPLGAAEAIIEVIRLLE